MDPKGKRPAIHATVFRRGGTLPVLTKLVGLFDANNPTSLRAVKVVPLGVYSAESSRSYTVGVKFHGIV